MLGLNKLPGLIGGLVMFMAAGIALGIVVLNDGDDAEARPVMFERDGEPVGEMDKEEAVAEAEDTVGWEIRVPADVPSEVELDTVVAHAPESGPAASQASMIRAELLYSAVDDADDGLEAVRIQQWVFDEGDEGVTFQDGAEDEHTAGELEGVAYDFYFFEAQKNPAADNVRAGIYALPEEPGAGDTVAVEVTYATEPDDDPTDTAMDIVESQFE